MPDDLGFILKNYLVVENKPLRYLMLEILSLCQSGGGPDEAIVRLDAKREKFSSSIDSLEKVPYCCLFLSYAFFIGDYYAQAVKWANVAIDGFDQLNRAWNCSIARWICALIYQKGKNPDDAERNFITATRLMTQEIQDHKRRSRYAKAKECEIVQGKLLEDAQLLQETAQVRTLVIQVGDSEIGLFQILLNVVHGDTATAERLIDYECMLSPGASRAEYIRRAIERWYQDNR